MRNCDSPCDSVKCIDTVVNSNRGYSVNTCNDHVNMNDDNSTYATDDCVMKGNKIQPAIETDSCIEIPASFPSEPVKPLDSDCCGSGCIPCVFDIYDQDMKIWKKECEKVKQKLDPKYQQESGPLFKEEYRKFVVKEIISETHNSIRLHIELASSRSLGLKMGQHVILRGIHKGQIITRQYTPITDVSTEGYFDLLIKLYEEGKMSAYIESLQKGSQIELRGPYGEYSYLPNKVHCLWMFAAGTGIAPMAQLIQGVLNNEEDDTLIRLYYACKTYEDILLRKELQDWKKYWNFSVDYILSQEEENSSSQYSYSDTIHRGHLSQSFMTSVWQQTPFVKGDQVLICGTNSFNTDILKYCFNLGLEKEEIFKF